MAGGTLRVINSVLPVPGDIRIKWFLVGRNAHRCVRDIVDLEVIGMPIAEVNDGANIMSDPDAPETVGWID